MNTRRYQTEILVQTARSYNPELGTLQSNLSDDRHDLEGYEVCCVIGCDSLPPSSVYQFIEIEGGGRNLLRKF
jgi:hypothetical protein